MAYGDNDDLFYYGTPSTLEPKKSQLFTGYRMKPSEIGLPTSPQTADQINAVSARLRQGMKTIEMGVASAEIFETIPKEQFKEINRLAKLTGAEITLHTPFNPTIDAAGFNERGAWSDSNREEAERRLLNIVEKFHDANPKGNAPITMHATHMPSIEWGKEGPKEMWVVNRSTGEIASMKGREHYYPSGEKKLTPMGELNLTNSSMWVSQMSELENQQRSLEIDYSKTKEDMRNASIKFNNYREKVQRGEKLNENEQKDAEEQRIRLQEANNKLMHINRGYQDLSTSLNAAYSRAYELDEDSRKKLKETAEKYNKLMKNVERGEETNRINIFDATETLSNASELLLDSLRKTQPKMYEPLEDFAREQASTTIANIAAEQFKEHGDKANTIAIENFHPNMAFGRAEQLRDLIDEAKEKFVQKVVSEQHIGKETAVREANRLIGATWDLAHINMLRGKGIGKEEIIKETGKIASVVKKVHLSDNFGFHDSHLSPGMGNTPTKEIMKDIEARLGKKPTAIVESGAFEAQFKQPAYPYALEAMGSSFYYPVMASYWAVPPGHAATLPEPYMSGFAPVPKELGAGTGAKKSGYNLEQQ